MSSVIPVLHMAGDSGSRTCCMAFPGEADQAVILPVLLPALFQHWCHICIFQVPRNLCDGSGLFKMFDRGLTMTLASLLNIPDTKSLLNIPDTRSFLHMPDFPRSAQDTTQACPCPGGLFRREPEVISSYGPRTLTNCQCSSWIS